MNDTPFDHIKKLLGLTCWQALAQHNALSHPRRSESSYAGV